MNIKISPLDKSLVEVTTQIYEDAQLFDIIHYDGSINDLNIQYPVECIRECNEIYRVSYCGSKKIAVLIYDGSGNKLAGNIYNFLKYHSDFEGLMIGQTLEDVQNIDPEGEYLFLYTGRNDTPRISSHYTKDGYLITIEYDHAGTIIKIQEELI